MRISNYIFKTFDTVIYPRQVFIVAGGTRSDIAHLFDDRDNDPLWIDSEFLVGAECVTQAVKRSDLIGVLVWFPDIDKFKSRNITHESVHAANVIFHDLGIEVDTANDEAQAYLAGFVSDCIDQIIQEILKSKIGKKK